MITDVFYKYYNSSVTRTLWQMSKSHLTPPFILKPTSDPFNPITSNTLDINEWLIEFEINSTCLSAVQHVIYEAITQKKRKCKRIIGRLSTSKSDLSLSVFWAHSRFSACMQGKLLWGRNEHTMAFLFVEQTTIVLHSHFKLNAFLLSLMKCEWENLTQSHSF